MQRRAEKNKNVTLDGRNLGVYLILIGIDACVHGDIYYEKNRGLIYAIELKAMILRIFVSLSIFVYSLVGDYLKNCLTNK